MWQAVRRNKAGDYVHRPALSFVVYATPVFFLGLVLIMVFTAVTAAGSRRRRRRATRWRVFAVPARALVLPVVTAGGRAWSPFQPVHAIGHAGQPRTRTTSAPRAPRARRWRTIVWPHVLRNSLTPVVAMLGYYVPVLFGGALVVEQLFNYPGMGLLFWNAAQTSDFPVLLGCVLVISVATVVGSLLADVVQFVIDPRARAGRQVSTATLEP